MQSLINEIRQILDTIPGCAYSLSTKGNNLFVHLHVTLNRLQLTRLMSINEFITLGAVDDRICLTFDFMGPKQL